MRNADVLMLSLGAVLLSRLPSAFAPPPGQDQATLTTLCETDGSSADYEESLESSGSTMERRVVSSTGCPNHVNWAINPNSARYTPSDEIVPAYPMLIDDAGGTTDLSQAAAAVGIMFNGVAVFSSWAGDGAATTYEASATFIEGDTFDLCGGHATGVGIYHYHNTAGCLQEQAMTAAGTTNEDHSPQMGWSHDGFPIYGQLGPGGVEMLVCGNPGANSVYCLDSCNGYAGELPTVDDFKYRYYASCGFDPSFFPFTTNCYRGCCPTGLTCGAHVEACGSSAVEGYTSDYVPTAEERLLDAPYDSTLIEGVDTDQVGSTNTMDCALYLGAFEGSSDSISGANRARPELDAVTLLATIAAVSAGALARRH